MFSVQRGFSISLTNLCPDCVNKNNQGINNCQKCNQVFDQVDNKYRKFGGVAFHIMKNNRTGKE
jgi:hypothetical protein